MIKLQIVGNLGKDCIVKEINGKSVINFSVAHTERFKDSTGNLKERTTWVECAYWTDRTAVAQYLKKGKVVYAEGSPEADAYMNKENQAAATLRMRVQNLQLLSSGNDAPQSGAQPQSASNNMSSNSSSVSNSAPVSAPVGSDMSTADDLPF
jgi:single-strand DNA-binding protein